MFSVLNLQKYSLNTLTVIHSNANRRSDQDPNSCPKPRSVTPDHLILHCLSSMETQVVLNHKVAHVFHVERGISKCHKLIHPSRHFQDSPLMGKGHETVFAVIVALTGITYTAEWSAGYAVMH